MSRSGDVHAGRLYAAHTGADRVDVIDCEAGTWLRSLDGHPGVAGVPGEPAGENCTASVVDLGGPHGLWVDGEWLYCAADGNALVILHRDTGATKPSPRPPR